MCALLRATAACRFYYLFHSTAAVVHAEDPSARLPRPSGVARAAFSVVSGCRPLGTRTCLARAPAACPRYARAVDSPFGAYLGSEEVESESQVRRILLRRETFRTLPSGCRQSLIPPERRGAPSIRD